MKLTRLAPAVVALAVLAPSQGHAQLFDVGVCVTSAGEPCSGIFEQIAQFARQALQLEQETITAVQEVVNSVQLPSSIYRDVTGDIQRIMGMAKQASMLQGYAQRMIQNLNSPTGFPDDQLGDWQQRLIDGNNSLGNALQQAALVVDRHQQELADDAGTLGGLQTEAMGNDGRLKTLQTIAGTNAAIGQVVQKHAGTAITGTQAQLTYYTAQTNRQMLFDKWDLLLHKGAIQGDCLALQQNGGSAPECSQ